MRYFLVDSENIKNFNFIYDKNVNKYDTVVIFFSVNSKKIDLSYVKTLIDCNVNCIFEEVNVGTKNALDFQLVSYLSILCYENKELNYTYYVVSDDNGFEVACDFIKSKTDTNIFVLKDEPKTKVISVSEISLEVAVTDEVNISKDIDYEDVKKLFPHIYLNSNIIDIINISDKLSEMHNSLKIKYKDDGLSLYKQIKPEFLKIKAHLNNI
ncbi:MAG: PIN domain-containing protein [Peptostreptococcaceae bacterium]